MYWDFLCENGLLLQNGGPLPCPQCQKGKAKKEILRRHYCSFRAAASSKVRTEMKMLTAELYHASSFCVASVMRRPDLTQKDLTTYIPTHLPTYLPMYLHYSTPQRSNPRDL